MPEVKKYWLSFAIITYIAFHLLGPTIKGATASVIGYSIGTLLLPVLICFAIIYLAKTQKRVLIGHITLIALSGMLIINEFYDERENIANQFFDGCRYRNAYVASSNLTDSEKDILCSCTGAAVVGEIHRYMMPYLFFYRNPPPIEQNYELLTFMTKEMEACTPSN